MTFKRPSPRPAKQYDGPTPTPRTFVLRRDDGKARATVAIPKNPPRRNREYLRWVAGQACAHCGRPGPSQAAHADEGKGMGIKAGDDTVYPLCADAPGRRGCHSLIGSSGEFSQAQRRELERFHGASTRLLAIAAGAWPEDWP